MNALQQWKHCPEFIDIDDQSRFVRLLKCNDLYAIRDMAGVHHAELAQMQPVGDGISIVHGIPDAQLLAHAALLPVYAAAKHSPPAVATNRIFLRFQEQLRVESMRGPIEALGFKIVDVPAYAPHSAWLEPVSGRVDEALSKLDLLRALPGAVHVQPQLLRPRVWKTPA